MNRSFPNFKQSLILLSFYFLPPGLILFLTITLPQIFGLEVSRIYITSSSIIAATIGLIPLILYINKNSGIQFNWTIQSPSLKTILFLTILASAIFIISDPFTNIREFIYSLIDKRLRILVFKVTDFDLNTDFHGKQLTVN